MLTLRRLTHPAVTRRALSSTPMHRWMRATKVMWDQHHVTRMLNPFAHQSESSFHIPNEVWDQLPFETTIILVDSEEASAEQLREAAAQVLTLGFKLQRRPGSLFLDCAAGSGSRFDEARSLLTSAIVRTAVRTDTNLTAELFSVLVRRSVVELLRGYSGEPYVPPSQVQKDPRKEAQAAFDHYVKMFNSKLQLDPNSTREDWEQLHHSLDLAGDGIRVPIACNTGAPGTGKTTLLRLLCAHARRLSFIDVYFTLNGGNASHQIVDDTDSAFTRVVRRILHGLVSHRVSLDIFLKDLKKVEHRCGGSSSFDDALRKVLPMIIRDVRNAAADVPILIAADELRKWSGEPVVGEPSTSAVACLTALAALSQASAAAHVEALLRGTTPTGVVYVVASALSAVDPAKGLVNRPVHFLPLPPLNPTRFDTAVKNALKHVASNCDFWKIYTLLRSGVFATRHNARLLESTAGGLHTLTRPIDVDIAKAFRKGILHDLSVASEIGVAHLKQPNDASLIRKRTLLRTLFHRSPFAFNDNGKFHPDMLSARHCEEIGIASILRDFETRSDAVCMTPQAIHSVLKDTFFHDPLTSVEEMLVNRLCSAMQQVPSQPTAEEGARNVHEVVPQEEPSQPKEDEGAGKEYEVVLGSAFTLRVATLPEAMSLYEVITGRAPPSSQSPHVDPFFTTTIVLPSKAPYVELASGVCFPHAAEQAKWGPFQYEATSGASGDVRDAPTSTSNPFFAHFENPHNLVLDYCVLVDAIANSKQTKLLLGLQMKEHAITQGGKGIADDLASVHQSKVDGLRKSTFPPHWAEVKKWLDAQGISFVVTIYAGSYCGSVGSPKELQSAQLQIDQQRDDPSGIKSYFRHSCHMHHEHVRHWSPSVAYSGCDARVLRGPGSL